LEDDVEVLLTPAYNYYAARTGDGLLVGFCCYGADAQVPGGDYGLRNAVDVGLGMNPALVGRSLSHAFLAAILGWGRQLFAPDYYRATVATINVRSLGMFNRAGFFVTQRFRPPDNDTHEFLIMVRAEQEADQETA
jgi:RimJ/RimL family protein N-acetyltransferase